MEFLPTFGTDELQRRLSGIRDQLAPDGGRWVNKTNGRHYAYITMARPEGFEVETISCHQFATRIGEMAERVSWGETFELTLHGEPYIYVTLTPSNAVAEADRRARYRQFGRVRELKALETTARSVS